MHIALAVFARADAEEAWMEHGSGEHTQYRPIIRVYKVTFRVL